MKKSTLLIATLVSFIVLVSLAITLALIIPNNNSNSTITDPITPEPVSDEIYHSEVKINKRYPGTSHENVFIFSFTIDYYTKQDIVQYSTSKYTPSGYDEEDREDWFLNFVDENSHSLFAANYGVINEGEIDPHEALWYLTEVDMLKESTKESTKKEIAENIHFSFNKGRATNWTLHRVNTNFLFEQNNTYINNNE